MEVSPRLPSSTGLPKAFDSWRHMGDTSGLMSRNSLTRSAKPGKMSRPRAQSAMAHAGWVVSIPF